MTSTVAKHWGQVLASIAANALQPGQFGLYLTFGDPLTSLITPASNDLSDFYQLSNFATVHDYVRISGIPSLSTYGGVPNNVLAVTGSVGIGTSGQLRALTLLGDGTPTQQILAASVVYMPDYGTPSRDIVMSWDSTSHINVPGAGLVTAGAQLALL